MISLEREIAAAPLSEEARAKLLALERRALVPVRPELRALLWLGVALLAGGVGVLIARNIDRIGHVTLIAAIALAAAGCYAFAWRRRGAQSVVAEYVLLLGALLLSADLAYAEAQLGILGEAWRWHGLVLATVHTATAYLFRSRLVVSLAIVALAGFFGLDSEGEFLGRGAADVALRAASAAAAFAVWRAVHGRVSSERAFDFPLAQAAFHLAMISTLAAIADESMVLAGVIVLVALAALAAWYAVAARAESFLIFAVLYLVVGIDMAILPRIDTWELGMGWIALTTPAAIAALFLVHRRWKERFA
ncbi:MAG: DUF2157 domain-containing protein [Thermoanaerobaculia bacterium]